MVELKCEKGAHQSEDDKKELDDICQSHAVHSAEESVNDSDGGTGNDGDVVVHV